MIGCHILGGVPTEMSALRGWPPGDNRLDTKGGMRLARDRAVAGAGARSGSALVGQDALLAFGAPSISARLPILSHGPVAGHDQRDRIRRTGPADRPRSLRRTQAFRDLAVRSGFAVGNRPQLLPHSMLERRGLHVYRKIEVELLPVQVLQDHVDLSGCSFRRYTPATL